MTDFLSITYITVYRFFVTTITVFLQEYAKESYNKSEFRDELIFEVYNNIAN